jgi:hypothetical protein
LALQGQRLDILRGAGKGRRPDPGGSPTAKWEITKEGNKTTITKKHPVWGAIVVFIGIVLIIDGIAQTPWLIAPTILILGAMVWFKVSLNAKAKKQPPAT